MYGKRGSQRQRPVFFPLSKLDFASLCRNLSSKIEIWLLWKKPTKLSINLNNNPQNSTYTKINFVESMRFFFLSFSTSTLASRQQDYYMCQFIYFNNDNENNLKLFRPQQFWSRSEYLEKAWRSRETFCDTKQ